MRRRRIPLVFDPRAREVMSMSYAIVIEKAESNCRAYESMLMWWPEKGSPRLSRKAARLQVQSPRWVSTNGRFTASGMNIAASEFAAVTDHALSAMVQNKIGQREQEEALFAAYSMRS